MSSVSFGTHIFGDKKLQLQLNLPKLIMNVSSTGLRSIRVGLTCMVQHLKTDILFDRVLKSY